MGMIPEVKCRRCGESFSSLRSRCPNCGTRRVTQSGRTPGVTPGTVKGTAAYERAETNTKWQMIFGLILVVSVILAVIVMVTTSLNGVGGSVGSVTVPTATPADVMPTIDSAPTPPPTPTPAVEKVVIMYANQETTGFTMHLGEEPIKLTASVLPMTIQNAVVTWTSGNEEVLTLTATEDGGVECNIIGTIGGGVTVTAECFGISSSITVYCVE